MSTYQLTLKNWYPDFQDGWCKSESRIVGFSALILSLLFTSVRILRVGVRDKKNRLRY